MSTSTSTSTSPASAAAAIRQFLHVLLEARPGWGECLRIDIYLLGTDSLPTTQPNAIDVPDPRQLASTLLVVQTIHHK